MDRRDLLRLLSANRGDNLVLTFVRPVPVRALGGLADLAVLETGIATLAPKPREEGAAVRDGDPEARAKDVLDRTGIESAEMYVASVLPLLLTLRSGCCVGRVSPGW